MASRPAKGKPGASKVPSSIGKQALTLKQKCFADEYLIDLNATQAAIRAGYSVKTAQMQSSRLLSNVMVSAYIAEAMKAREERTEITQDMVLRELAKIGFSDIRKVVRWGATELRTTEDKDGESVTEPYHGLRMIAADEIDDATAAAISEVSESREGLKVKLYDKRSALVDIGRHLGMFKDKGPAEPETPEPTATAPEYVLRPDEEIPENPIL